MINNLLNEKFTYQCMRNLHIDITRAKEAKKDANCLRSATAEAV